MRSEQEIFDELAKLCSSSGYIHAIAYLCFRDNMIRYSGEMTPEDMQHMFSTDRLIRTETSTLIGLLIKNDIDFRAPPPNVLQQYIDKTEALLNEIHQAMSAAFSASLDLAKVGDKNFNPFTSGAVLREPIFYSGESAYSFQYRDLSPKKYARDNEWLTTNRGFSLESARDVVHAIERMQNEKTIVTLRAMQTMAPDQRTLLPGFTFTAKEVAEFAGNNISAVEKVLTAFALPKAERNSQFNALHDFNVANALPLIPVPDDQYVLFHIYSLTEALYESPFYWMGADKAYVSTAMHHRGRFTEEFSSDCLERVFGKGHVHSNVDILESKGTTAGEIDVLVLFGNRAIVLQAKSKRLTLEARKGNDGQIRDDFKKSIQDSCDQGYRCARMLRDRTGTLRDGNAKEIAISTPIKEVYVLCVVSDHYPALSFQTRQFLQYEATDGISPPFVLDVFTLDAMTEMLQSPLQLLSYIDRRTRYSDKLMASHELTILSYHLKQNLWLSDEHDMVTLDDDISTDLDIAMLARRGEIHAKETPDGILTRFAATTLGRFVKGIEARPDPGTIDLGFMLLTLGEETVVEVSRGIEELAKRARADGKGHDLTVGLGKGGTGFTVHCNNDPIETAGPSLERHCRTRKYTEHAQTWFGVCVRPGDTSIRFGLNLDYPWARNAQMDALTQNIGRADESSALLKPAASTRRQAGRNEPCPCGSGKKYKKCCLSR